MPSVLPAQPEPRTQVGKSYLAVAAIPWFPYACLLVAVLFSIIPIASSLWLDETATYWVVKDGIRDVFARSWAWSGQSALYYLTAWIFRPLVPLFGLEIALRLPSLLAFAVAVGLLYRLGRYLMDRTAAMIAALAFVSMPAVAFAAIDARPYALGLALVLASMLSFFRWLDTGKIGYGALYMITTALVVYCHYLLALALFAQLIYGTRHVRKLAPVCAGVVALCLPLAGQVLQFYQSRHSHSIGGRPNLGAFFVDIATPVLAGSVLIAVLLSRNSSPSRHRIHWPFLFAWLVFPPASLLAISLFTATKLFGTRYYLSCAPAAALLAGYAISRLSSHRLICGLLTAWLAISIWQGGWSHGSQDWRGAMAAVNSQASAEDVILVATGFVEGAGRNIDNDALREVLFAPQLAYPIRPFQRLPYIFEENAVPADLNAGGRVFLITSVSTLDSARAALRYHALLERRVPGSRASEIGSFGSVSVLRFTR